MPTGVTSYRNISNGMPEFRFASVTSAREKSPRVWSLTALIRSVVNSSFDVSYHEARRMVSNDESKISLR